MNIDQKGYNIYAMGPAGVGKRSLVLKFFRQQAEGEPVPPDWVYVNNFETPHRPRAIQLPPGKGAELQQDMDRLVEDLRTNLSAAFDSDEYRARRSATCLSRAHLSSGRAARTVASRRRRTAS